MSEQRARIILAAEDKTAPAFASLRQRLGGVQADAASLGAGFAGLGATIGALGGVSFVALIKGVADGLDKLNDLRDATGASVENISALEAVAAKTGVSFDTVSDILIKFNKALNNSDDPKIAAVFDKIGLSVKDLKALDPAEALQKTVQAFGKFAADGSRARAEQVLFNRTIKEGGKFLQDLGEESALHATATKQMADEAKQFNDRLDTMAHNATITARNIGGPLLKSVNDLFAAFQRPGGSKGGWFADLADTLSADFLRARMQATTEQLSAGLQQYQQDLALLKADTSGTLGFAGAVAKLFAENRVADYQKLQDAAAKYRSEIDRTFGTPQAGGGRGFVNPPGVAPPSLGDTAPAKAGKAELSAFEKLVDKLRQSILATRELTAVEQTRYDINSGKLGKLSADEAQHVLAMAQTADNVRKVSEFEKGRLKTMEEGAQLFAQTRTDQEKLNFAVERAGELVDAAAISWDTYARVMTKGLTDAMKQMDEQWAKMPKLAAPLKEISTFADQAARNIQDALGDSLFNLLDGKFNDIGKIWGNLIKKMAAQAAAAKLNSYLFGDSFGTAGGSLGGAVGSAWSWLAGASARASGGPVRAGQPYLVGERGPEIMVPSSNGSIMSNGAMGGSVNINQTLHIGQGVSRAEVYAAVMQANAQAEARMRRLQREGVFS